jgi:hypothetical protein
MANTCIALTGVCGSTCFAVSAVRISIMARFRSRQKLGSRFDSEAPAALLVSARCESKGMSSLMNGTIGQQFKIVYNIVQFVAIFMMYNLGRQQSTSKVTFHNQSLFGHSSTIGSYDSISKRTDTPLSVRGTDAVSSGIRTRNRAVLPPLLCGRGGKWFPAKGTYEIQSFLHGILLSSIIPREV